MAFNHMDKEQQITSEMREYYFQDFEIDMKMAIESNQFALCIPNHIQQLYKNNTIKIMLAIITGCVILYPQIEKVSNEN